MAKIRGVKPDYWTDEDIVELSIPARLLFIGMWNYACDNGHLQDKPKQIKMRILPADDVNVTALIRELDAKGVLFKSSGWITIPNLTKHQKPDRRYFTTCDHPDCDTPPETVSQRESRRVHGVHTPGTRSAHDVRTPGARGDGDGDGDGELKGNAQPSASTREISDQFEEFWKLYPRREGRGRAFTAFKAALKKTDAKTIMHGVEEYVAWTVREATQRKYMAHPTTWLNGERWADEREDVAESKPTKFTSADDLELPPDGLTPEQYRKWAAERKTA